MPFPKSIQIVLLSLLGYHCLFVIDETVVVGASVSVIVGTDAVVPSFLIFQMLVLGI